ncbi:MAG TPA: winged helix-turn-helix transcriptional regulator [Candidatus Altiarchaeales archaeon]|nr:winged helix-turn-helix transcriptional regulator [Candidatus Altiarchaeales archaeon]
MIIVELEQRILELVESEEYLTPAGLASRLDMDLRTVEECLHTLQRRGWVRLVTLEKMLRRGK